MLSSDRAESGIGAGLEVMPSRRHRIWITVAIVAAAVIAAGFGAVVLVWDVDGADGARAGAFDEFPEVIEAADEVAALPAAGPVGQGALVYQACRDCDTVRLVLHDGEQLLLSESAGRSVLHYSLSPDGRWLTAPGAAGVTVRDLTDTDIYTVQAASEHVLMPWAWSPDSERVLFGVFEQEASGATMVGHRLLHLEDGTEADVDAWPEQDLVAVSRSGQVLGVDVVRDEQLAPVRTLDVEVVDPGAAGSAGGFTVDASEWLESGETLADNSLNGGGAAQLILAPEGDGLYLTVFEEGRPVALLRSSDTGQIEERIEVGIEGIGRIAGQVAGHLVVAESRAMEERFGFYWTLFAVSSDGMQELTTLAPAMAVRLAGTAAHGGSAY